MIPRMVIVTLLNMGIIPATGKSEFIDCTSLIFSVLMEKGEQMIELKPCPFCGAIPKMIYDPDGEPSGVHCKCGALVRFLFMPKHVREPFGVIADRIAERYNRRAENER